MKRLFTLCIIALLATTATVWAQAVTEIRTAEELNNVRNDPGGSYKLMNDIDLTDWIAANSPTEGWQPIGISGSRFTGSFDGNGHTIKGLWIDRGSDDNVGLFGYVDTPTGSIKNLSIEVATGGITGLNEVGALAGWIAGGTISACSATGGKVEGYSDVGGLVGYQSSSASLTASYAGVEVEGDDWVGGLAGMQNGPIDGCFATGNIKATSNIASIGGLVGGQNSFSTSLTNSYATGMVKATGTNAYIGGLVGIQLGAISTCYATGKVEDNNSTYAGGLVGWQLSGTITDSYYNNTVNPGLSNGLGSGLTTTQMRDAANYTGWNFGTPDPVWYIDADFNNGYPYLEANITKIYTQADLAKVATSGTGDLAKGRPFKLMNDITLDTNNGQAGITDDKGWEPIGTETTPFTGSFDGNGYAIKGLWINRPFNDYIGLFGVVNTTGTIKNLSVEVATGGITGQDNVGALAGRIANGTISACSATGGKVKGNWNVGGLVGYQSSGLLTASYADVEVEGADMVGGLAGEHVGTIDGCFATGNVTATAGNALIGGLAGSQGTSSAILTNSYATGTVTAKGTDANIGGLVGLQLGAISTCYATGKVVANSSTFAGGLLGYQFSGTITSSYYDTETTGMTKGVGYVDSGTGTPTGLTTEKMIDQANYTGWNINASGGATSTTPWVMGNRTYPYFYWQPAEYIVTVPPPVPTVYHTITLEVDSGIQLYDLMPGELVVAEGDHLHLQFLPLSPELGADDLFLTIDGVETHFKYFGGNHYFSYILNPVDKDYTIRIGLRERPTGNAAVSSGHVNVAVDSGKLRVDSDQAIDVAVYTIMGQSVASVRGLRGTKIFDLPAGVYIVRAGNQTEKIINN